MGKRQLIFITIFLRTRAEYDAIQAQKAAERKAREKAAAAKAAAARRANADLRNNTPNTWNDGMMFNAEEFDDDVMLDAAATVYPTSTSQTSSSSSSQVERIPTNQDSFGIFYDQNGQPMTVQEVRAYAARHNLTLQ